VKTWNLIAAFFLIAGIAFGDDFKTIDGKEYKNVTVSRVEPDGFVLVTSVGISKVYFTELPKEVRERFHYDATTKAASYSADQVATQETFRKQQQAAQQKRAEEREKYWRENPTPEPQARSLSNATGNSLTGSALDRPAYGQSAGSIAVTSPEMLVGEYAASEIKADNKYKGRICSLSGTIKSIFQSGGKTTVELYIPYYHGAGRVRWMNCIFNDLGGLEQKTAGNPISLRGTVVGLRGNTLTIDDCHL
jgi:tRNA_anti-like